MAWQDDMIMMLRVLVSDMSSTPTYSDGRMEQILVVAAQYVQMELTFDTTYTIDLTGPDISPDPTGINDDAFVNLTVMKAACITDFSTFRTQALQSGVKTRCGPVILDTLRRIDGFKQLLDVGPCAAYEAMKKDFVFGTGSLCSAILSPFCSNNFNPESLGGYSSYQYERGGQHSNFYGFL